MEAGAGAARTAAQEAMPAEGVAAVHMFSIITLLEHLVRQERGSWARAARRDPTPLTALAGRVDHRLSVLW